MSAIGYRYEERQCQVCKGYDVTYRDGHHVLWYYASRRYAHAQCMAGKFGMKEALAKLHAWQRPLFKKSLKHPVRKSLEHPMVAELKGMK